MSKYYKFLTGRFAPKNNCYCADGEVLFLPIPVQMPKVDEIYHFSGVNKKNNSQLGWVSEGKGSFSTHEFVKNIAYGNVDNEFFSYQEKMLNALSNIEVGVPVGVSFFWRGMPRKLELVIHKIILY